MTLLSVAMTIPLLLAPFGAGAGLAGAVSTNIAIRPLLIYLTGYFLFGAGYIAYMTFMIAYVRDGGGGAPAQSAFWCLIGASAFLTPWVWRRVLARNSGGVSTAIIQGVSCSSPRRLTSSTCSASSQLLHSPRSTLVGAFTGFTLPCVLWRGRSIPGSGQSSRPRIAKSRGVSVQPYALPQIAVRFRKPVRLIKAKADVVEQP